MPGLSPIEIGFDAATGALSPATGRYRKRLSQLEGVFRDADAWSRAIQENADPLVYEVNEYKKEGSDIFFGTTTMQPGKVGEEYFMTRGQRSLVPLVLSHGIIDTTVLSASWLGRTFGG